jgi:hypothetical protein
MLHFQTVGWSKPGNRVLQGILTACNESTKLSGSGSKNFGLPTGCLPVIGWILYLPFLVVYYCGWNKPHPQEKNFWCHQQMNTVSKVEQVFALLNL